MRADALGAALGPLLNSERIERVFGSYGVDVAPALRRGRRVAHLYSCEPEGRVTRTLALTAFGPAAVTHALREPHAAVLGGASIGATLSAHGWQVRKDGMALGWLDSLPPWLRGVMRVADSNAGAAVQRYRLLVARSPEGPWLHYCTIDEIHSPLYLALCTLARLCPGATQLTAVELHALAADVAQEEEEGGE